MKGSAKLLQTGKTVFTVQTLKQILDLSDDYTIRNALHRYSKQWFLKNLYYGVWWLPHYDKYELANMLKTPSYISLETVLYTHWVIFQYYADTIFCISTRKDTKVIENTTYEYCKIHNDILYNPAWLIRQQNYLIASVERAICDRLYVTPDYYFDNLRNIHRPKVYEIAQIYNNKRLLLDIIALQKHAQYHQA